MKKKKGSLVFELAVGQCAVITINDEPDRVLRTSKVTAICSISADGKVIEFHTEHGTEYKLLID